MGTDCFAGARAGVAYALVRCGRCSRFDRPSATVCGLEWFGATDNHAPVRRYARGSRFVSTVDGSTAGPAVVAPEGWSEQHTLLFELLGRDRAGEIELEHGSQPGGRLTQGEQ